MYTENRCALQAVTSSGMLTSSAHQQAHVNIRPNIGEAVHTQFKFSICTYSWRPLSTNFCRLIINLIHLFISLSQIFCGNIAYKLINNKRHKIRNMPLFCLFYKVFWIFANATLKMLTSKCFSFIKSLYSPMRVPLGLCWEQQSKCISVSSYLVKNIAVLEYTIFRHRHKCTYTWQHIHCQTIHGTACKRWIIVSSDVVTVLPHLLRTVCPSELCFLGPYQVLSTG